MQRKVKHVIENGIEVDLKKTEKLINWSVARNAEDDRKVFLFCGAYIRFFYSKNIFSFGCVLPFSSYKKANSVESS